MIDKELRFDVWYVNKHRKKTETEEIEEIKEKTNSIMRCHIPHIQEKDIINGDDLRSIVFALLLENQNLQNKIDSLEIKLKDVKSDYHKMWS